MTKIIGSCTSCQNDIEEGALENGSAEVIEVEPGVHELYCFDCAEKYREYVQSLEENQ